MRSLLFLVFAAHSCEPAKAKQPLNDVKTAVLDSALNGSWQGKVRSNGGDAYLIVAPHSGAQLDLLLIVTDDKGGHVLHYQGHAAPGKLLSLRAKSFADPLQDAFTLSPRWIFAKYALADDGALTLAWLEAPADGSELANPRAYAASKEAKWVAFDATFRRTPGGAAGCCEKCAAASRNDPSGIDLGKLSCSKYRYDDACHAYFAEHKTPIGECWKR